MTPKAKHEGAQAPFLFPATVRTPNSTNLNLICETEISRDERIDSEMSRTHESPAQVPSRQMFPVTQKTKSQLR